MEYKRESDDPYKILAYNLVVDCDVDTIKRYLTDNKFLRRVIKREIRGQDYRGVFMDCLFVSIVESKKRMDLMHALDSVGAFFYQNLDKPRLRREIKKAYEELDMADLLEEDNSVVK